MEPKRHHFLPQFYLRGFLDPDKGYINVLKVDDGNLFQTNPSNIGCEKDWNRIGDDRSSAEEHFAKIDGVTSEVLKKTFENEILPTEMDDMVLLIYFAGRLCVHNPSVRNGLRSAQTNYLKHLGRWRTSSPGVYYDTTKNQGLNRAVSYEQMRRFVEDIDEGKSKIVYDHGYFLGVEDRFIEENLLPLLCRLHWSLLIIEDYTESFVCSDRPVFLNTMFTQFPDETEFTPGFAFTLPLNRRMCLYADTLNIFPGVCYINKEDEHQNPLLSIPFLNTRTIYEAKRQIYAADLNWEITTISGEKRNANSLIGKNIKNVVNAWHKRYSRDDKSLRDLAFKTVLQ